MLHGEVKLSDETLVEWQEVVDLMAKIVNVPAGLIMKLSGADIEVHVSSQTKGNPYKPGDREHFKNSGLYCETVINKGMKLLIPDALADKDWKDNPDVKLNMISYLGFPLTLPNGLPFGTICVLDNKANKYSRLYEDFVGKMRGIIQRQLSLAFMNQELGDENKRLTEYLEEIKTLRAIIPICCHCKDIRDDEGFWKKVEDYLGSRLGTSFSHGICPDCVRKYYPEIADKI